MFPKSYANGRFHDDPLLPTFLSTWLRVRTPKIRHSASSCWVQVRGCRLSDRRRQIVMEGHRDGATYSWLSYVGLIEVTRKGVAGPAEHRNAALYSLTYAPEAKGTSIEGKHPAIVRDPNDRPTAADVARWASDDDDDVADKERRRLVA
jgi:hypothetical protein